MVFLKPLIHTNTHPLAALKFFLPLNVENNQEKHLDFVQLNQNRHKIAQNVDIISTASPRRAEKGLLENLTQRHMLCRMQLQ